MKKKRTLVFWPRHLTKKILLVMRLTFFLIVLSVMSTFANTYAQMTRLNLNIEEARVKDVLNEIEEQSEFFFMYDNKQIDVERKVDVHVSDEPINEILLDLFDGTDTEYRVVDKQILLYSKADSQKENKQKKKVNGKVADAIGNTLPGVTVVVKGTTIGTTTNNDGKYSFDDIPEDATLVFSFVGMKSQEIFLDGRLTIDVVLEEESLGLEELVVIGYGTQKKVNLTGAIAAMDGDVLSRRQVAQTSMALQGVASGVVVTQRSGQPGADAGHISIRGKTTLGNSNPLILVDGVEMGLNDIDASMIASISVLKDAASASIYGSRAANGVILVTTKRGQKDKFSVSYNGYAGVQRPTDLPNIVGAMDHMEMTNEAYVNVGKSPLYSEDFLQEYKEGMSENPDRYPDTDWYDEVLSENALMQNHTLNLNGGSERIRVAATFGYLDQKGIMASTDYERYTMRINTDMQISDSFSAQIDAHVKQANTISPSKGTGSAIHWCGRIPANQTSILSDGTWGTGWNGENPLAFTQDGGIRSANTPSITMNIILKYEPADWISMNVAYSPNYYQSNVSSFVNPIQTYQWNGATSYQSPQKASLYVSHQRSLLNNLRSTMTLKKEFGNHAFKFLAGYQQEDYRTDVLGGYRENFAFPNYTVLNAGGEENQKTYGYANEWSIQSFFGRLNYNFKERYLLEANFRYDGSSRFATGHKWGIFPSFSAGWRVSEEAFFENVKPIVSNLKVRGSWGQLGNQDIGYYPFSSDVSLDEQYIFNKTVVSGAAITSLNNTEISWETTTATNIGLDVTLWDYLNVTADYYYKVTNDILLSLDIPLIIGMYAPVQNAGKVENKGWDLNINYMNWDNEFKYEVGFNVSDVKNKVLDLKGVNASGVTVNHEGYAMYSIYGLESDGYISEDDFDSEGNYLYASQFGNIAPGDIKYIDQNNDTIINASDYVVLGGTIPRFTFGFNFNAQYKNIDFGLFLQGVGKADGMILEQGIIPFVMGGTVQEQHKDHWTTENTDAAFPRLAFNETNNEQTSDFWMKDAAYLRLKNLQIGYTLPASVLNRIKAEKIRIYFSGQNLLTLDSFWDGYDVEAPVGNGGYYPQVKTFSIGVDVKF